MSVSIFSLMMVAVIRYQQYRWSWGTPCAYEVRHRDQDRWGGGGKEMRKAMRKRGGEATLSS